MSLAIGQITIVDFNDVTIASSAPATPVLNQLWFDTSITPPALKQWNGTTWVSANISPQEYQNILATISGTTNYRSTGAPTNNPTPLSVTTIVNADSSVDIKVSWDTYVQGTNQADNILVLWKKGTAPLGAPTLLDNVETTNVNTSGPSYLVFPGMNPSTNYAFGLAASRRTENGNEIGTIVSPAYMQDITAGTPNFTGNINGIGATGISNWADTSTGTTKIKGGLIMADSISAGSLNIGSRSCSFDGVAFSVDKSTNIVSWTAGTVSWIDDTGAITSTAVSAGNYTCSTAGTTYYFYWTKAAATISTTTTRATAFAAANLVVGTYFKDTQLLVINYGKTVIDGSDITAGTITGDRIKANTITSGLLATSNLITSTAQIGDALITTAKIASLDIGSAAITGDLSAGRMQVNAGAAINSGSTAIDPGKISVSGTTTLADWRHGSDLTKIDGGDIYANSITANKLSIGNRNISIQGIEISANSPTLNTLYWSAGVISYIDNTGTAVTSSITASSVLWSSGTVYLYWTQGATTLSTTTTIGTAFGANNIVLASYRGGTDLVANYGRTIVDGSDIVTGTITASSIKASTLTSTSGVFGTLSGDEMTFTNINGSSIKAGTITADRLTIGATKLDRLRATGTGSNASDTTASKVYINGAVVQTNTTRGHKVYVYDRTTHAFVSGTAYDTYGGTVTGQANAGAAQDAMATALNALGTTSVVCIVSYDAIGTNANLVSALKRCGATGACAVPTAGRYPYVLIGIPGMGEGTGLEQRQDLTASGPIADVSCQWVDGDLQGVSLSVSPYTTISGGQITTGAIQSTNYGTTTGSKFDLSNGAFSVGGDLTNGKLIWDGTTLKLGTTLGSNLPTQGATPPSGSGLILAQDYMGFYSSNAWKTYIKNNGSFYFAGNDANNYIAWDGTTNRLAVRGTLVADDITTGYIKSANYAATAGSRFDMSNGVFSLGGDTTNGKLIWDGTTLKVTGTVNANAGTFSGSITATGTISGGTLSGATITGGTITGGSISINSGTFAVSTSGALTASSATISGSVTATSGYIGTAGNGWVIGDGKIYKGRTGLTTGSAGIYIGTDGIAIGNTVATPEFQVTSAGALTASSATISGSVTATSGYIGTAGNGWVIGDGKIYKGRTGLTTGSAGIYLGTDGIAIGNTVATPEFQVTSAGALVANNATLTGSLTATNISTTNGKFNVDTNGFMTCVGANMAGKIDKGFTINVSGGCSVVGLDGAKKTGGTNNQWSSQAYSSESHYNSAYISFTVIPGSDVFVGLDSNPAVDPGFTTIDYAFNVATTGQVFIYENGVQKNGGQNFAPTYVTNGVATTAWTANTIFEIWHDGTNVNYKIDGAVVATTAASNKTLYFDSCFYKTNDEVDNLRFAGVFASSVTGNNIILGDGCAYGKLETYNFDNATSGIRLQDGPSPVILVKKGTIDGATLNNVQFSGTATIAGSPLANQAWVNSQITNTPMMIIQKRIDNRLYQRWVPGGGAPNVAAYTTTTVTPTTAQGNLWTSFSLTQPANVQLTVSGLLWINSETQSTGNVVMLFAFQNNTCIGVATNSNTIGPLRFEFDCKATGGSDNFAFYTNANNNTAYRINDSAWTFGGSGSEARKSYIQVSSNPFQSSQQNFASYTSNGTWTAPTGVTTCWVTMTGGGGAGGGNMVNAYSTWYWGAAGAGGGATTFGTLLGCAGGQGGRGSYIQNNADASTCIGYSAAGVYRQQLTVVPGTQYTITIGMGGGHSSGMFAGSGGAGNAAGTNGIQGNASQFTYNTATGSAGGSPSGTSSNGSTIQSDVFGGHGQPGAQNQDGVSGYCIVEW